VQDGTATSFINDVKIHEQKLPDSPDPWLALHSVGNLSGGARNVRITGKPTIPDTLDLTELPDLTSWLTDYYGESNTGDNADWKKQGEEIVGRKQGRPVCRQPSPEPAQIPSPAAGRRRHIEYEFYYEPGKTLVHPALDRLTFLLDPAGVRVHWLTDAQFDRTRLGPRQRHRRTSQSARSEGPAPQGARLEPAQIESPGRRRLAGPQRDGDLRAEARTDQPARVRPLPLHRRNGRARPQSHVSRQLAEIAACGG